MLEPVNLLVGLAVEFVRIKYPKEFLDPNYSPMIFELIEMVGDELAAKNFETLSRDYFDQFVSIKDLPYGDTEVFYMEEI